MSIDLIRTSYYPYLGEGWYSCHLCGAKSKSTALGFRDGHIEPCVGETLVGADGDTAIVSVVTVTTGRWCAGDASGLLSLTSINRLWQDATWGTNGGSIWGNYGAEMTQAGNLEETADGILHPKSHTVEYKGKRYCLFHYDLVARSETNREIRYNFRGLE